MGHLIDSGQLFSPEPPDLGGSDSPGTPAGFDAPLVQVFDCYIMYQGPDGVIIVDQHSAHERVLYEAVMLQLCGTARRRSGCCCRLRWI